MSEIDRSKSYFQEGDREKITPEYGYEAVRDFNVGMGREEMWIPTYTALPENYFELVKEFPETPEHRQAMAVGIKFDETLFDLDLLKSKAKESPLFSFPSNHDVYMKNLGKAQQEMNPLEAERAKALKNQDWRARKTILYANTAYKSQRIGKPAYPNGIYP